MLLLLPLGCIFLLLSLASRVRPIAPKLRSAKSIVGEYAGTKQCGDDLLAFKARLAEIDPKESANRLFGLVDKYLAEEPRPEGYHVQESSLFYDQPLIACYQLRFDNHAHFFIFTVTKYSDTRTVAMAYGQHGGKEFTLIH